MKQKKGLLFIIAAPSGGGKTSLVNRLLEDDAQLKLSISHTTRPPRPAEIHGEHYYFITTQEFEMMIQEHQFVEYATVFDALYGTSREQIQKPLEEGLDVILEIDWQGAQQVRRQFSEVVSIFILPPSYEVLERRLRTRAQDDAATIERRMQKARNEILHCGEFDFIVFNDVFEDCLNQLKMIISTERLRYEQQCWRSASRMSSLLESDR